MSRRGENIYKRKDGRWEGRYLKGRKENGKIKYGYIYGHSYGEVKKKLYPYKLHYQEITEKLGDSVINFEELANQWLSAKKWQLKASTYASYHYKLLHYILPTLGKYSLNECTDKNLQKVVDCWSKENLNPNTIKILFRLINQCLSYAVKQGYLKKNSCPDTILPKNRKRKVPALSISEQKRLEAVANEDNSIYGKAIIFSLRTGLRIGEIAALRWESIDFETNTIKVESTLQRIYSKNNMYKTELCLDNSKTESSKRVIPLSNQVKTLLLSLKKQISSSFVFTNTKTACEPRLMTYHFHRIRKRACLEKIHFHQLRHTFATRCLESQADIASISALLGHSSTQMTLDIYADSLLEQRRRTLYKMEQLIA